MPAYCAWPTYLMENWSNGIDYIWKLMHNSIPWVCLNGSLKGTDVIEMKKRTEIKADREKEKHTLFS